MEVRTVTQDDELLDDLRLLFALIEPSDPQVIEQGEQAYRWRTTDAELAELGHDSLVDQHVLAGVRDDGVGAGPRLLGFGTVEGDDDLEIEIEVGGDPKRPALLGQLMPPMPATVYVESCRSTTSAVRADELGHFRVQPVPPGPVRLRIEYPDRKVQTSWVSYVRS
jgi:hypothetical protein